MLGPLLEKSVAANPKVTLVKLNVDEANELAAKFKVMKKKEGVLLVSCINQGLIGSRLLLCPQWLLSKMVKSSINSLVCVTVPKSSNSSSNTLNVHNGDRSKLYI